MRHTKVDHTDQKDFKQFIHDTINYSLYETNTSNLETLATKSNKNSHL